MREFAKRFYQSRAWKVCRAAYITSRFGICERCDAGGKIVHHKIYLNERNINNPDVTLNHDNLELLCQDCHNEEHMGTAAVAEGLRFDANGQLIRTR